MYEELVKRLREAARFSESRGYSGMANTAEEAADAIEELSKPRWIPVAEQLPESGEYVWAVYKNSLFPNGKSHHKTLKYDGEMWIDDNGYRYLTANITHWKKRDPLPEPPKEET